MADRDDAREQISASAECPAVSGGRLGSSDEPSRAIAPASSSASEAAPPSSRAAEPTDETQTANQPPASPVPESAPKQVDTVVVWKSPKTDEPYVLPPKGIIAYILGNRQVWRRFIATTLVIALTILTIAVAVKIAGIQLVGIQLDALTVSVASASTALGVVGRAYFRHRKSSAPNLNPDSNTTSNDDSSSP